MELKEVSVLAIDQAIYRIGNNIQVWSCHALADAAMDFTGSPVQTKETVELYSQFHRKPSKRKDRKFEHPYWWSRKNSYGHKSYRSYRNQRVKALEAFKAAVLEAQKNG